MNIEPERSARHTLCFPARGLGCGFRLGADEIPGRQASLWREAGCFKLGAPTVN